MVTLRAAFFKYQKRIIALLRQEFPLKNVLFLLKKPDSKYKEVQEHLNISAPFLSYHLNKLANNKLAKNGIVQALTYNVKGYSLQNPDEIAYLLKKHKIHAVVDSFKDVWEDLDYYDRHESFTKNLHLVFLEKHNSLYRRSSIHR